MHDLPTILTAIIADPCRHVAWLNSLSYLEYCGAQKIAAYSTKTTEHSTTLLQHLAEEFRHAFFFRKLADTVARKHSTPIGTVKPLLLGTFGRRYLHILDLQISRMFRQYGFTDAGLRHASYILTTYTIEVRAVELYNVYESLLQREAPEITLRSVLKEEATHLKCMHDDIAQNEAYLSAQAEALAIEEKLFVRFLKELK